MKGAIEYPTNQRWIGDGNRRVRGENDWNWIANTTYDHHKSCTYM